MVYQLEYQTIHIMSGRKQWELMRVCDDMLGALALASRMKAYGAVRLRGDDGLLWSLDWRDCRNDELEPVWSDSDGNQWGEKELSQAQATEAENKAYG